MTIICLAENGILYIILQDLTFRSWLGGGDGLRKGENAQGRGLRMVRDPFATFQLINSAIHTA